MIRIRASGEIVTPKAWRALHPNVAFPAVITQTVADSFGADLVTLGTYPNAGEFQLVEPGDVEQIEGVWTQTWTVSDISVEDARATLRQRVAAERLRREQLGVAYTFSGDVPGVVQTRDDTDTRNIQGVVTTALILQAQGVTDPVLSFRDAQNVEHPLTPSQAIALGMTVSSAVKALYSAKWAHDAAIELLPDTAACAAYDTDAGWPP